MTCGKRLVDARTNYAELWDSLNAKTHPWWGNWPVWAYTFERVAGEGKP